MAEPNELDQHRDQLAQAVLDLVKAGDDRPRSTAGGIFCDHAVTVPMSSELGWDIMGELVAQIFAA